MRKLPVLALVVLTISACSSGPKSKGPGANRPTPAQASAAASGSGQSSRGLAFAQANCSGCHAVTAGRGSPNPEAPPFEVVVNTQGLTAATLKPWLRNSHNFPTMMNFAIAADHIDDLAAYMTTLQRSDYTPPIQ